MLPNVINFITLEVLKLWIHYEYTFVCYFWIHFCLLFMDLFASSNAAYLCRLLSV
jgi:hypothetical protein